MRKEWVMREQGEVGHEGAGSREEWVMREQGAGRSVS